MCSISLPAKKGSRGKKGRREKAEKHTSVDVKTRERAGTESRDKKGVGRLRGGLVLGVYIRHFEEGEESGAKTNGDTTAWKGGEAE